MSYIDLEDEDLLRADENEIDVEEENLLVDANQNGKTASFVLICIIKSL